MTIPTEKEFSELIEAFKKKSLEPYLPYETADHCFPNESDCHAFLNRLYDACEEQDLLLSTPAANIWLERQPSYWNGMGAAFGERPKLAPRLDRIKETTQWLLKAYGPISDNDYQTLVEANLQDREDYIFRKKDSQKHEAETMANDPRHHCYLSTDDELLEQAIDTYPIPSQEERNSEEYRTTFFRGLLRRLYKPNCSLTWSIFFAEAIRDYFYGHINIDKYSHTARQDRSRHLEKVLSGAADFIGFLEERENEELAFQLSLSNKFGPLFDENRILIKEIELVLMDARDELEDNLERLNNIPIIKRKDKTLRERVLVYKFWSKFREYDSGRNVIAISHFLALEGIENNLDPRTIDRLIHKWSIGRADIKWY